MSLWELALSFLLPKNLPHIIVFPLICYTKSYLILSAFDGECVLIVGPDFQATIGRDVISKTDVTCIIFTGFYKSCSFYIVASNIDFEAVIEELQGKINFHSAFFGVFRVLARNGVIHCQLEIYS